MATSFAGVGATRQFGFFEAGRGATGDPLKMIACLWCRSRASVQIVAAVLPVSENKITAVASRSQASAWRTKHRLL
jgi:hypothetical protein